MYNNQSGLLPGCLGCFAVRRNWHHYPVAIKIFHLIRVCFVFVTLMSVSACSDSGRTKKYACVDDATVECLEANFNCLYTENYRLFWDILHNAANDAEKCSSNEDVIRFLSLVKVDVNNAEFTEFLSVTIEQGMVRETSCFMSALTRVDDETKTLVIKKLGNPMFVSGPEMERIFIEAKSEARFKALSELYFKMRGR